MEGAPLVGLAGEMFAAWGQGLFSGDDKDALYKKFMADDCTIDATADMKNSDMYKEYTGMAGFHEWIEFLTSFDFEDFTPVFTKAPGNKVLSNNTYKSTYKATGKKTPEISDVMEMTYGDDGKITSFKFFWGNPESIDEAMEGAPLVGLAGEMFAAWGQGLFSGDDKDALYKKFM